MTRRLAIDFFSPLPPLPTAIGNHTETVLGALRELADLRVWTSQPGPISLQLQGVAIHRFRSDNLPLAVLNQADAAFYNIGNNFPFHYDIHEVSRRVPGIVILHDIRLQHFFAAYCAQEGPDRIYYLDQLERFHGSAMRAWGEEFVVGLRPFQDMIDAAPMTLAALHGAAGGILHNAADLAMLEGQTTIPLYHLNLCHRCAAAPVRVLHDPGGPCRLIMFGFIGENRRLLPILEALAGMEDRDRYRLDVYGIVEQADDAHAFIDSAGLGDLVRLHGFVPEPVLDAALAQADLALNLRWPSMGEASATQLRIWSAGLPALVTHVGWYAQLPPDTVFLIDPTEERVQLVQHLRALRRQPAQYARAGRHGRLVVERDHSPEAYAEGLVAIARQHVAQHARMTGQKLAERAARRMLELGSAELAQHVRADVVRSIADLTGA